MTPTALYNIAKNIASGAYINPWHDIVRARIMIIGFLANLGYGTLSFTLNYAMAGVDIYASLEYQMLRMALMAYFFVPFTFWFLSRYKSRLLLFIIQILALSLYFINPSSGIINAFAVSFAFTPFLALHNYRFSKNISRENRGNEAALNTYLIIFSYSAGLFMGGVLLQHNLYFPAVIGGSLCTIIAAFFLYFPMDAHDNAQKVWSLIGINKPSTRISFFYGIFNPMVDGCLPVWMRIIGISPVGAGLNLSLRPIIGLMLTPLVGWLIQKKGLRAAQIGGVGVILGWILMTGTAVYPWLLALALGVLSIATNLVLPMEVSRWYKRRSSAGTISRELLVCTGRIPSYAVGITTCFLLPAYFPLLGLILSGLFVFGTRPTRKGMGRRVPT